MDMYKRDFVYSREQKKDKEKIFAKINKVYTPGSVIVKGRTKPFTDIVLDINKFAYSDAQLVVSGDIRQIKYVAPSK